MAGKHAGIPSTGFDNPGSEASKLLRKPAYPGSKVDRAYAEGRLAGFGATNPHPAGTPENVAFNLGGFYANSAAAEIQTGIPAV